jgi:hypothetical protein
MHRKSENHDAYEDQAAIFIWSMDAFFLFFCSIYMNVSPRKSFYLEE